MPWTRHRSHKHSRGAQYFLNISSVIWSREAHWIWILEWSFAYIIHQKHSTIRKEDRDFHSFSKWRGILMLPNCCLIQVKWHFLYYFRCPLTILHRQTLATRLLGNYFCTVYVFYRNVQPWADSFAPPSNSSCSRKYEYECTHVRIRKNPAQRRAVERRGKMFHYGCRRYSFLANGNSNHNLFLTQNNAICWGSRAARYILLHIFVLELNSPIDNSPIELTRFCAMLEEVV